MSLFVIDGKILAGGGSIVNCSACPCFCHCISDLVCGHCGGHTPTGFEVGMSGVTDIPDAVYCLEQSAACEWTYSDGDIVITFTMTAPGAGVLKAWVDTAQVFSAEVSVDNCCPLGGEPVPPPVPLPCTACGGTCDDSIESLVVDIGSLVLCETCSGINDFPDALTMTMAGSGCDSEPMPMYTGVVMGVSGDPPAIVQAELYFREDGCYELLVWCYAEGGSVVEMWQGCKGGSSPVGTYTCMDDGGGNCVGCNTGVITVDVTAAP